MHGAPCLAVSFETDVQRGALIILKRKSLFHSPNWMKVSYHILKRTERRGRKQWGVAFFICEEIAINVLLSHSNKVCEILITHVIDLNLIICITYWYPDAINFSDHFLEVLSRMTQTVNEANPQANILLTGYLGFRNFSWPEGTIQAGTTLMSQRDAGAPLHTIKSLFSLPS